TAPEDLGGFESRAVTMQLNLRYNSSLTNEKNPLKVRFAELSDIESRNEVARTYSNGEVKATVSLERPVPLEGGIISFRFRPTGPGRINSEYRIDYRPSRLFADCPQRKNAMTGNQARYSCRVSSNSTGTRNLVFSTSYKYVKSP
ncbi:MAG: hypothetical protein ABEJ91_01660, partial [Candidatus Nanohaloarchaea archaeon]